MILLRIESVFLLAMNILMIAPPPDGPGPVSRHTPMLVNGLRQLGCEVDITDRPMLGQNVPFVSRLIHRLRDIPRIVQDMKRKDYDLVVLRTGHDYQTLWRDLPILFLAKIKQKKIVVQFHGSDLERLKHSRFFRWLTGLELKLCSGALLLSSEELKQFEEHYSYVVLQVVNNPLPPLPPLSGLSKASNEPTVLFVGRMIEEKGGLDVIEAFAQLAQKVKCKLVMAGDGPIRDKITTRVQELELEDWVSVPGYLRGDNLWDVYKRATIFVLPTWWQEGQPTVLLEAAHFGLPIITTPIRAAVDIFVEGENALFVSPHSPDILSENMYLLLTNAKLREGMSQANQELVKSFAPVPVAERYFASLKTILKGVAS